MNTNVIDPNNGAIFAWSLLVRKSDDLDVLIRHKASFFSKKKLRDEIERIKRIAPNASGAIASRIAMIQEIIDAREN